MDEKSITDVKKSPKQHQPRGNKKDKHNLKHEDSLIKDKERLGGEGSVSKLEIEDENEWKQFTDKEYLVAYPLTSLEDKLDEDYLIYMKYAGKLAEKGENENEYLIYKAWLDKLTIDQANTVSKKRTRNIYLSQLMLQLRQGTLNGIFSDLPPEGILPPASEIFHFSQLPPKKSVEDLELETPLKETQLQHLSTDGRTYLASKSLPNNSGLCGYLAVSTGEANKGLWLDSSGRPTDLNEKNNPKGSNEHKVQTNCKNLKPRATEKEIGDLIEFIKNIIYKLEKIIKNTKENSTIININDPIICNMFENLKKELCTLKCGPKAYNPLSIILALKERAIFKLNSLLERTKELDKVIKGTPTSDGNLKLVDLANKIGGSYIDELWNGFKSYKPSEQSKNLLNANYQPILVEALLNLFEKQKMKIFEQEKNSQLKTESDYRIALVEEIRDYVQRYLFAKNELMRINFVLDKIEVTRKIFTDMSGDTTGKSNTRNDKILLDSEETKRSIYEAQKLRSGLNIDLSKVKKQIKDVSANYKEVYYNLKKTDDFWTNQLYTLEAEMHLQIKKIKDLNSLIKQNRCLK